MVGTALGLGLAGAGRGVAFEGALGPLTPDTSHTSHTQVHGHCETAVRRSALLACGQVLAALPAPRLSGVLLGTGGQDPSDVALAQRLRWMKVGNHGSAEEGHVR